MDLPLEDGDHVGPEGTCVIAHLLVVQRGKHSRRMHNQRLNIDITSIAHNLLLFGSPFSVALTVWDGDNGIVGLDRGFVVVLHVAVGVMLLSTWGINAFDAVIVET